MSFVFLIFFRGGGGGGGAGGGAATRRVFAISPIFSSRFLYCVGEQ